MSRMAALCAGALTALSLATLLVEAGPAAARVTPNLYVSTHGRDNHTGSAKSPWRTIQHAVDRAPSGAVIHVAPGRYAAFVIRRPGITVSGRSSTRTTVVGNRRLRDVVRVEAPRTRITNLGISSCVPKNAPGDGFENGGASGIGVDPGADRTTIDHVRIVGKRAYNRYHLNFACFGIALRNVNYVTVRRSVLTNGGYGVFIRGGGRGTRILHNSIHDNNSMIRNTPRRDDDFGGSAVGFENLTTRNGAVVAYNDIYNNVAPSHDYVTDGGGFDLFQSSNVQVRNNRMWNNENILESGYGATPVCNNDVFANNVASGRSAGSRLHHSIGMFLRCGSNMRITGNRFSHLDWWTFDIQPPNGAVGPLRGLTVTGNTITQSYDVIWSLPTNTAGGHYNFGGNRYSYRGALAIDWRHQFVANSRQLTSMVGH